MGAKEFINNEKTNMLKIHLLGNPRQCYTRHLHPIRVFQQELYDSGFNIKYYSTPAKKGIEDCDILIFFEASYRDILPIKQKNREAALGFLINFFGKFSHVIWFDDHDSSGTIRTYVLPYVNIYAKSQLMKNLRYYQEPHLTGAIHRDFVHENFQVNDKDRFKGSISNEDISKFRVSWNLGMQNWAYFNSNSSIYRELITKHSRKYEFPFSIPDITNRKLSVTYRSNPWNNTPTVNWWRKQTQEGAIRVINSNPKYKMNSFERINKPIYQNEIQNAIVTVSPFGIGEICYRDFECFIFGSILFKPDMDHLSTWPNLYIDGKSYISHKWDFSDFDEKLLAILENPILYQSVALEGQRCFRNFLSDGQNFVNHFKSMITIHE